MSVNLEVIVPLDANVPQGKEGRGEAAGQGVRCRGLLCGLKLEDFGGP